MIAPSSTKQKSNHKYQTQCCPLHSLVSHSEHTPYLYHLWLAITCLQCFDTVGWVTGRASGSKHWVMMCWCGYLSAAKWKWFAYGPADATATASSLASLKSRMVYLSGAGLPRLSWRKRPLNGCNSSTTTTSSSSSSSSSSSAMTLTSDNYPPASSFCHPPLHIFLSDISFLQLTLPKALVLPHALGTHIGNTAFPQWPVISNLSIICPCHLDVLQILRQRVTPELPGSSRSSFAIFWEPQQHNEYELHHHAEVSKKYGEGRQRGDEGRKMSTRPNVVQGPRVWNSLPAELRAPGISLTVFRNKLKTYLFDT